MNETHFKRFLMIIRSSGFITKKMLGSSINVINFSYILYLSLKREASTTHSSKSMSGGGLSYPS